MPGVVGGVVPRPARGEAGGEHDHDARSRGKQCRELAVRPECTAATCGWTERSAVTSGLLEVPGPERPRRRDPLAGTVSTAGELVSPSAIRSRSVERESGRSPGSRLEQVLGTDRLPVITHGGIRPAQPPTVAGAASALPRLDGPAHRLPVSSVDPTKSRRTPNRVTSLSSGNVAKLVNRRNRAGQVVAIGEPSPTRCPRRRGTPAESP